MGVQGVGGFLIIVLLISLVAGGLGVHSYNQHNLIQEQNTVLVGIQNELGQANEQITVCQTAVETSKKEILQMRSQIEACSLTASNIQQENNQLKARIVELVGQLTLKQGELDQALAKINIIQAGQPKNSSKPSIPVAQPAQQGNSSAVTMAGFNIADNQALAALPLVFLLVGLVEVAFRAIVRVQKTETIRVTEEERDLIIRYRRSRGTR